MRLLTAIAAVLLLTGCSHRAPAASPPTIVPPVPAAPRMPPDDVRAVDATEVGIEIGQRAPDFTLTSFEGRTVRLNEFRGRPVVIDFWAGWCPFCVTELPALERAYQANRGAGLAVIGVHRSDGEDRETGERFARERGATFSLLQDEDDRVYRQFAGGTPAMPLSYFIDRDGMIRAKLFGPKTDAQIAQHLERIW